MPQISLKCVTAPFKGKTCFLFLGEQRVGLVDQQGEPIASLTAPEALTQIQLPSFWLSRRYIGLWIGESGLEFEPDIDAVKAIKRFMRSYTRNNPAKAGKALHRWGVMKVSFWTIVLGMSSLLILSSQFRWNRNFAMGGVVLVCSITGVVLGIRDWRKGRTLLSQASESDGHTPDLVPSLGEAVRNAEPAAEQKDRTQ